MKAECAGCGRQFEAKRSTAKWCSDRCRKRPRTVAGGSMSDSSSWVEGRLSPSQAIEILVAALEQRQILSVDHVALVANARAMAAAVELDPAGPGMWREFRSVEQELRSLFPSTSEFDLIVASLREDTLDLERRRREEAEQRKEPE